MTFPITLTSPHCPRDRAVISHGYRGDTDWYVAHWQVRHGDKWESATNGVPLAQAGDSQSVILQAFGFMLGEDEGCDIDHDDDGNIIAHRYDILCVVKGSRLMAANEASERDIPFVFVRETEFGETIGRAPLSRLEKVASWFAEPPRGFPYPQGALLFYNLQKETVR